MSPGKLKFFSWYNDKMFTVEPLDQSKLDALVAKKGVVELITENNSCFKVVPREPIGCICHWDWEAFYLLVLDGMVPKIDDSVVHRYDFLSSDLVLFETDDDYVFYSIANRRWVTVAADFSIRAILNEHQLFELYQYEDYNSFIGLDKRSPDDVYRYYDYIHHSSFETVGEYQPGCERLNVKKHAVAHFPVTAYIKEQ